MTEKNLIYGNLGVYSSTEAQCNKVDSANSSGSHCEESQLFLPYKFWSRSPDLSLGCTLIQECLPTLFPAPSDIYGGCFG